MELHDGNKAMTIEVADSVAAGNPIVWWIGGCLGLTTPSRNDNQFISTPLPAHWTYVVIGWT